MYIKHTFKYTINNISQSASLFKFGILDKYFATKFNKLKYICVESISEINISHYHDYI